MAGACLDPGPERAHGRKTSSRAGQPQAIFNASLTELESHRLPAAVAQAIHTRQPMSAAATELAQAQAAGVRLLTWDEPQYPQRLCEIYDPPPLPYVQGNIELLNRHLISIVGSRRPTPDGNQMAGEVG
jgi:DNA processing protein